ncbi:MAG: hypothetical protein K9N55_00395 [Phycisphaerae bacterium]|nr:hypothetical protein [Phycisphaerae bacterium]
MKRTDLEHIIRAAGSIAEADTLIILGSQAILASYPQAPHELLVSQEADTYPLDDPTKADLIDGSIGELSPFHEQFGYYAHGVGPETATLAPGWRERLVALSNENTRGVTGLCLHPTDLAVSKLIAGRDKDIAFVAVMLKHDLVSAPSLHELISTLSESDETKALMALERSQG